MTAADNPATRPAGVPMDSRRLLTMRTWRLVAARAGRRQLDQLPAPVRPVHLASVQAATAIYVPLKQLYLPKPGLVAEYVGSVARDQQKAVWQRIVTEHQTTYLERLLSWDWVAVVPLHADTPTRVVRLIEAAIADALGRPPACLRLPKLPANWEQHRDQALPATAT